jgi:hypothetical protein
MVKIFSLACPREVTPLPSPAFRLVFGFTLTHTWLQYGRHRLRGEAMDWDHLLAYITGTAAQERLVHHEDLVTEPRLLRHQINGRIHLSAGGRRG